MDFMSIGFFIGLKFGATITQKIRRVILLNMVY